MKLKTFAVSTWFAVASAGCTLNPIGEDPGINRDSDNSATAGEGSPSDGVFAPEQDTSTPESVDPATGTPVSPGGEAPAPVVIDPNDEAPAGDIISEPEAVSGEPILQPEAPIDGGVPFNDAGDAGDAAVPLGAR